MHEPSSAANPGYSGYSLPQSELRRREGIGRNLLDRLLREGEVDSFILGHRIRHIVLSSWFAYIARQRAGVSRDPIERERAITEHQASVRRSKGGRAAALARSGWGPDHGKRGGSPHRANREVSPARRPSPPTAPERRTNAGKARNSRKESVTNV
jgi:hypothetical protein